MNVDVVILVFITLVPATWLVFGLIGIALRTKGRLRLGDSDITEAGR